MVNRKLKNTKYIHRQTFNRKGEVFPKNKIRIIQADLKEIIIVSQEI